jgi:hypothetical protein
MDGKFKCGGVKGVAILSECDGLALRHTRVKIEVFPSVLLRDRVTGRQKQVSDDKVVILRPVYGRRIWVSFWTSILLSLNAEVLKHPVYALKSQPDPPAAQRLKRYSLLWMHPRFRLVLRDRDPAKSTPSGRQARH